MSWGCFWSKPGVFTFSKVSNLYLLTLVKSLFGTKVRFKLIWRLFIRKANSYGRYFLERPQFYSRQIKPYYVNSLLMVWKQQKANFFGVSMWGYFRMIGSSKLSFHFFFCSPVLQFYHQHADSNRRRLCRLRRPDDQRRRVRLAGRRRQRGWWQRQHQQRPGTRFRGSSTGSHQ